MDIKKANEIVESLGVVDVNYRGYSVWIEGINEETNEVSVKDLKTNREFTVDVTELNED
ncbi:H-type small acid-soluble spore protein [Clostridium arbusti]|uniref:H-type small acid-soluble spore protein n=1 Tax=Clostridium arbusti TaxID=1137848 RepID=UPI00028910D7|nr:H-type small acid-soluble spore protein [Clostridium arbusti]